jgi:hypothetical protein
MSSAMTNALAGAWQRGTSNGRRARQIAFREPDTRKRAFAMTFVREFHQNLGTAATGFPPARE